MPNTLFARLFLLMLLVMSLHLAVMRLTFWHFLIEPAGRVSATAGITLLLLADAATAGRDAAAKQTFADDVRRRTGLRLAWQRPAPLPAPPNLPFYAAWQRIVHERFDDAMLLAYQTQPEAVLWLVPRHGDGPLLGVPADDLPKLPTLLKISLTASMSFALAASFWVARRFSAMLREMAAAAQRLGRDLRAVPVNPRGPDEVRALGDALNRMSHDLDYLICEQEFLLAGISHDLRTPLTRLRLAVEMLGGDGELRADMVLDIAEIDQILQRFIELTRFNIEETEAWHEADVGPLLRSVADKYQRIGVRLHLRLQQTPPLRHKPQALQRLLYNLVDNAVKYGGEPIVLTATPTADGLHLCVSDDGPGFPAAVLERLGGPEARLQVGGVGGLGLHIIRRIVKLHAARLTVDNPPAGGAAVHIHLPLTQSPH